MQKSAIWTRADIKFGTIVPRLLKPLWKEDRHEVIPRKGL